MMVEIQGLHCVGTYTAHGVTFPLYEIQEANGGRPSANTPEGWNNQRHGQKVPRGSLKQEA